ncbi:MAG: hypothetical protein P9M14_18495 [Candidatus Alcyoniella australis]|nr:hypothetical protein [Candidatus Alcyoniella australis]
MKKIVIITNPNARENSRLPARACEKPGCFALWASELRPSRMLA